MSSSFVIETFLVWHFTKFHIGYGPNGEKHAVNEYNVYGHKVKWLCADANVDVGWWSILSVETVILGSFLKLKIDEHQWDLQE